MKIKFSKWIEHPEQIYRDVLYFGPEKLAKHMKNRGGGFYNCPMYQNSIEGFYVLKCPYNIKLEWKKDTPVKVTFHDELGRENPRQPEKVTPRGNKCLSIHTPYLFYTKEECAIEVYSPMYSDRVHPWHAVPGKFDISKWIRPVDFSIEVKGDEGREFIKRGEPFFYVKFTTGNPHEKFEIEEIQRDANILDAVRSCTALKHRHFGLSIEDMYEAFCTSRFKESLFENER